MKVFTRPENRPEGGGNQITEGNCAPSGFRGTVRQKNLRTAKQLRQLSLCQ